MQVNMHMIVYWLKYIFQSKCSKDKFIQLESMWREVKGGEICIDKITKEFEAQEEYTDTLKSKTVHHLTTILCEVEYCIDCGKNNSTPFLPLVL